MGDASGVSAKNIREETDFSCEELVKHGKNISVWLEDATNLTDFYKAGVPLKDIMETAKWDKVKAIEGVTFEQMCDVAWKDEKKRDKNVDQLKRAGWTLKDFKQTGNKFFKDKYGPQYLVKRCFTKQDFKDAGYKL